MTDLMALWLIGCVLVVAFSAMAATPARRLAHVLPYRQWRIIQRRFYDWKELGWA